MPYTKRKLHSSARIRKPQYPSRNRRRPRPPFINRQSSIINPMRPGLYLWPLNIKERADPRRAPTLEGPLAGVTCLARKPPISSTWSRLQARFTMILSWYRSQGWPMSASNLTILLFGTPVVRTVALIEHPSTRATMTRPSLSLVSTFVLAIVLDRSRSVKDKNL